MVYTYAFGRRHDCVISGGIIILSVVHHDDRVIAVATLYDKRKYNENLILEIYTQVRLDHLWGIFEARASADNVRGWMILRHSHKLGRLSNMGVKVGETC